jgi:hypothetical protein
MDREREAVLRDEKVLKGGNHHYVGMNGSGFNSKMR